MKKKGLIIFTILVGLVGCHSYKNMPYVSYWNNEMYEIIGPQKEYCIYNHGVGEPDHFWR